MILWKSSANWLVTMVRGGLSKSCYTVHVNGRQPVRLSSKLKLGGYCHSGYLPPARYRRVWRTGYEPRVVLAIQATAAQVFQTEIIRGTWGTRVGSTSSSFPNVYDRFYLLRGSVAVTAIWVLHLKWASMRDSDRLNVFGGRYEQFACFHGRYYSITCTIVYFLSWSPIHEYP